MKTTITTAKTTINTAKTTITTATLACSLVLALSACGTSTSDTKADPTTSTPAAATTPASSNSVSPSSSTSARSLWTRSPGASQSAPAMASPSAQTPSGSASTTSSAPPLAGGMPTKIKNGDIFMKGVESDKTRAVEQHECGTETAFYVKDHYLYTCDTSPDKVNRFHLVVPCSDLIAEDKKAVGDKATQQTWKKSGKLRELFAELPDKRLRYLITLVQKRSSGETVARGSTLEPYTHKEGEEVHLSFPMWTTDQANQYAPTSSLMTVCFAS